MHTDTDTDTDTKQLTLCASLLVVLCAPAALCVSNVPRPRVYARPRHLPPRHQTTEPPPQCHRWRPQALRLWLVRVIVCVCVCCVSLVMRTSPYHCVFFCDCFLTPWFPRLPFHCLCTSAQRQGAPGGPAKRVIHLQPLLPRTRALHRRIVLFARHWFVTSAQQASRQH